MDTIIAIIVAALAVWYLYRRFAGAFKSDQAGCGCSGCSSCSPSSLQKADHPQRESLHDT